MNISYVSLEIPFDRERIAATSLNGANPQGTVRIILAALPVMVRTLNIWVAIRIVRADELCRVWPI